MEGEWIEKGQVKSVWETQLYRVNEGAAVIKRNGKIFMSYSASGTDYNYAVGLLTADQDADLLDPDSWEKSPVPVYKTSEENGIFGPRHNGFTTTPDGKHDLIIYHARSYKKIDGDPLSDPNRHTRVQPLEWADDGTPVLEYQDQIQARKKNRFGVKSIRLRSHTLLLIEWKISFIQ